MVPARDERHAQDEHHDQADAGREKEIAVAAPHALMTLHSTPSPANSTLFSPLNFVVGCGVAWAAICQQKSAQWGQTSAKRQCQDLSGSLLRSRHEPAPHPPQYAQCGEMLRP